MEKVIYNWLADRPHAFRASDVSRSNKVRIQFKEGTLQNTYPFGLVGYFRTIHTADLRVGIAVTGYSLRQYGFSVLREVELIDSFSSSGFDLLDIARISEIIPTGSQSFSKYWILENKNKFFFDRK